MSVLRKAATNNTLTYLLGICVPSTKQNAAKIRVRRLVLDENLLMYFPEHEFLYAHDPKNICKIGDTVLVQNLAEKLTRLITHRVVEVVYPLGDIVDPVTGKKIVASKYRDHIAEDNELFGRAESSFDYTKAPPRGSMEDKRDFSHKKAYVKYHDDPNIPQPYGQDP